MKRWRTIAIFFLGGFLAYALSYAPAWRLVQAGYISADVFANVYAPFLRSDLMFRYADFFQRKG